jgi:L-seryl-tRNA(Ser) seleniumtransferase
MEPPADVNAVLRRLPKVDEVLGSPALGPLLERAPRWAVVSAVRDQIARLRRQLLEATSPAAAEPVVDPAAVANAVAALLRPSLERVVNATGVVLHTNLGRAPLPEAAVARIAEVARGYSNLELSLDERRRGSRHDHVRDLLRQLTGAEDALVVNNCAGAVLLALAALAQGREVVVSRGELVEIGGSFRVPDVMRASGARLVEVGTTNRTRALDYERAISPDTALLMKVHRSNFAVVGFTAEVAVGELAELGRAHGVLTMVDLGSGALVDLETLGVGASHKEPRVPSLVAAGADVIAFSGDKLLGGPQAGILVGTRRALEPLAAHPLTRALRPDKLTLGALEATLELYRDGRASEIPTLAMLTTPEPTLKDRATRAQAAIARACPHLRADVVRVRSAVGGGALPLEEPWSWAVAVAGGDRAVEEIDRALRLGRPAVVGRLNEDRLLIDMRTVAEAELPLLTAAFEEMARGRK